MMSYTMEVYSPQEKPLLKEQLKTEMDRRGLAIAFCAYAYKIENFTSDGGPFDTDHSETIVACESNSSHAGQFKEIVQSGDAARLHEMLINFQVYNCVISYGATHNINDDWAEEEIEDMIEDTGAEYVEGLRQARSTYSIQANIFFGEFAATVWRAIGSTVDGMLEDGQQSIVEFVAPNEV